MPVSSFYRGKRIFLPLEKGGLEEFETISSNRQIDTPNLFFMSCWEGVRSVLPFL